MAFLEAGGCWDLELLSHRIAEVEETFDIVLSIKP